MLKQQQPFIALVLACFVSAGRADTLYEGALIYSMDENIGHILSERIASLAEQARRMKQRQFRGWQGWQRAGRRRNCVKALGVLPSSG